MSPLTVLWVASIIGASLFYSSGVLSSDVVLRLLGGKFKLASLSTPSGGLGALRGRLAAGNTAASPSRGLASEALGSDEDAGALRRQLEIERRELAGLQQELADSRVRVEEARQRLGV